VSERYEAWRGFRLLPDDVLFFRDGRPATRGDDHYLPSIFPPHPSTLYGAIRTRRLLDEGVDLGALGPDRKAAWKALPDALREELGEWGGFGCLELRGPWLVRGEREVLVPAPGDLGVELAPPGGKARTGEPRPPRVQRVGRFLQTGDEGLGAGGHSHRLGLLRPFEWKGGSWQEWDPLALPPRLAREWYLTPGGFERWAGGGAPEPGDFVHRSELWVAEPRVGVAIEDDDRTAREGHLFTFGFVRLREHVTLGFEARHTALQAGRRVRLGGEGRTCWIEDGPPLPMSGAAAAAALRLVTVTPLLSAAGAGLPGVPAKLRAASVSGHLHLGGWDLARGGPKPLRRAVPAGAVYLVESSDATQPLDPGALHGTPHSDFPEEHLAAQGFGLILAGAEPERP